MSPPADAALLRQFLAGDTVATRQVESWAREVIRYKAYRLYQTDADDLVQQTVIAVWRAAQGEGFSLQIGFKAFVRHVAIARCVDAVRRARPTVELTEAFADTVLAPYLDQVFASDEGARLRYVLRQLGAACQEVIRLHFYDEMPYAAIAETLGRAEATMRVRMFNCIKEIRKLLGEIDDGPAT